MPQNPQNTRSQTTIKYYNQFRSVRTEAIRWLKIATDPGNKLKVETKVKKITSLSLMYLRLNNNIIHIRTS